jgi:hypothetical protein
MNQLCVTIDFIFCRRYNTFNQYSQCQRIFSGYQKKKKCWETEGLFGNRFCFVFSKPDILQVSRCIFKTGLKLFLKKKKKIVFGTYFNHFFCVWQVILNLCFVLHLKEKDGIIPPFYNKTHFFSF